VTSDLLALAPLIPALTLAAYLLHVSVGPRAGWRTALFGIVAMGLGAVISAGMLVQVAGGATYHASIPWLSMGGYHIVMGMQVGPLQALMLTMVTTVSCLIEVYSIGYMHGDSRYNRFFANVTLFVTGMLTAILADNLILFFAAWEIMGLCSYLLIGHWYEDPANCRAANKAFLVTRIGDVGFLLGIWWAFSLTHTFSFSALPAALHHVGASGAALTGIALLIFLGAVGKSAQIPLQIWLPDAMAGPTPISALIHAATMVAAGVYLVARTYGIFEMAPHALYVVALVGAVSAFVPATIACVQTDIKKTLAYSTISQLGYMMLALGVGALGAGIFHLLTHACFKALLFLGSGSVIHATGTQDMHRMGGLARRQKVTAVTFGIGTLALAAIFPFSGYFSKDAILAAAYSSPDRYLWLLATLGAGLTAYYMARCYTMTFLGRPRDEHAYEHAHESPAVMTVPLILLAIPAALLGFAGVEIRHLLLAPAPPSIGAVEHLPLALAVAGLVLGYVVYSAPISFRVRMLRSPVVRAPYTLFRELWYFEPMAAGVRYAFGIGPSFAAAAIDRYVVDGLVGLVAHFFVWFGRLWRGLSTGNAQAYMLTVAVAAALGIVALQLGGVRLG
jgi:NADH-quinone oxidoreductase subunit L